MMLSCTAFPARTESRHKEYNHSIAVNPVQRHAFKPVWSLFMTDVRAGTGPNARGADLQIFMNLQTTSSRHFPSQPFSQTVVVRCGAGRRGKG
jgi:hypothetical protein